MAPREQPFRVGHAAAAAWRGAVDDCLAQIGPQNADDTIGFVYPTDALVADADAIVATLKRKTGIDHWTGATGAGIIGGGKSYLDRPALSVMVGSVPKAAVRSFAGQAAQSEKTSAVGIVHAEPSSNALGALIDTLADAHADHWFGGITAPTGRCLSGRAHASPAFTCLTLDRSVSITTGLAQGCAPIGKVHEITDCDANAVIALDGRPAFAVFCQDIGDVLARRLDRVAGYIFAGLVVEGSSGDDYLVRGILGIEPRAGAISIGMRPRRGDRLLFCRRDRATAMQDLKRMIADLRRRLPGPPRGALYFSCLSRSPQQFDGEDEARLVHDALAGPGGTVPLVGMLCNGEISDNRLHAHSGVLAVFS